MKGGNNVSLFYYIFFRLIIYFWTDLEESKTKINEQIKSLESKLSLTQQIATTLQVIIIIYLLLFINFNSQEKQEGGIVDIREDYNSDEESNCILKFIHFIIIF